jgi:predicted ATPase/class 3 adenylate cyclase
LTLPTGTVAFLFSDVEASTRRWEHYGEAMRDALRRHDEILRSEIETRRGYVFKTIGDAFCAAFWTVDEALEAALEAQRRLGSENFTAVDGLYVRMSIHAGETDERGGDYFGTAVNRTARLLSAAHGGQILLSGFAADLALRKLPDGIALRHLGTLPLRDLKEPERVYQPIGAQLRSEFKPLRALETPPNNLPRETTSFVGRYDDAARLEALLDENALVTIVGAGGIGKTRLALEVAASRLNDERDGAWFIDLSPLAKPELIVGTILSGLGAEQPAESDPLGDLLRYLEKRELLLVLDNSEHLISEVAGIVAQVTARCPNVTLLATSRAPLDISGERVHRLSSLDLESSVQLFGDRARAVDPRFNVESKAKLVEAICRRLDGIALAIELAAARMRTMSVESLASHLELRLLRGGRDRRPRQQTMPALIDWSYNLLTDDEQRVLRRCAVFLQGFTLGAAAAVCDSGVDEWPMLDLLASLVDKSLVIVEVGDCDQRYRLLEPIREYAREKLGEAGELMETRRRHALALASLAAAWYEEWDDGPAADWLVRVVQDLSNLRAALDWSADQANDSELGAQLVADATIVFLRLALLTEGVEWCDRILQAGLQLSAAVEARLRYGLSMLYSNLGANKKCLEEALHAVPLYRGAGDPRGLSRALSQVASRYPEQSRYDEAKAAAEESLRIARASGDRRLLADALRRCAAAFAGAGPDATRAHFEESVTLFRTLGRDDDTARALAWWGQWEDKIGSYRAAAERLEEALAIDERDQAVMYLAGEIANAYLAVGDRTHAEAFARKALTAAAKLRHQILSALAMASLAASVGAGNPRKAARLIGHAQESLRAAGWVLTPPDDANVAALHELLKREFEEVELTRLLAEGAALSEEQAVSHALSA